MRLCTRPETSAAGEILLDAVQAMMRSWTIGVCREQQVREIYRLQSTDEVVLHDVDEVLHHQRNDVVTAELTSIDKAQHQHLDKITTQYAVWQCMSTLAKHITYV